MHKRRIHTADVSAGQADLHNCFSGVLSRLTGNFGLMIAVFTAVMVMAIHLDK
ncbi:MULTISPECIES: hypothetical protein [Pseudomonas]|uniref:Uncharacterized protein n=1 Tax=Pseudomonas gingeri TaxID=117681 RepID=A0A7Y7WWJ9_9PSED|nr:MULTISPECIES: hypothetical protein [Pseudomonas]NWB88596.1 hypothetical protein [Pseudomonas gingeri]